jgi:uncharacterized protein
MEEKVGIKNSKGLKLAAIINYPDKNKQYPAMIILHGFTGYKEEAHLKGLAEALARNGFTAIRFDCSGSGDSEGNFEKNYSMSNYLGDIKDVYNCLRELEYVDKDRVGIAGHSMGGLLSIVFASLHQEIKTCIAISSPIMLMDADWLKGAIERWQELGWFYRKISRDNSNVKIPFSFVTDANKFDALNFVRKLHRPFLMVMGLSDNVVYPDDSRKIFQAANDPKELVEVAGMEHHYEKHPEISKMVNEKILAFLKKYL